MQEYQRSRRGQVVHGGPSPEFALCKRQSLPVLPKHLEATILKEVSENDDAESKGADEEFLRDQRQTINSSAYIALG